MNELTVTTGSSLIEAIHNGTPITVPERREIYLKYVHIAGWNYREDIEKAFDELEPGTRLTLRREPTNEHDELAIKVLSPSGIMIGYVPRHNNAVIARLMDIGKDFYAVLTPRESVENDERPQLYDFMYMNIYMRE